MICMPAKVKLGLAAVFTALTAVAIIGGRIATFHYTEMEALVEGWRWWISGLGFMVIAMLFCVDAER